jgi:Flp pilus assembly pilin Flp
MNAFTQYRHGRSMRFAQSLIEYAAIVGLVVAVFIAMNTYMRRGIQGALRIASDEFGNQGVGRSVGR